MVSFSLICHFLEMKMQLLLVNTDIWVHKRSQMDLLKDEQIMTLGEITSESRKRFVNLPKGFGRV